MIFYNQPPSPFPPATTEGVNFDIAAFAIYNRRLYLLDPTHHQLWRYQKTSVGYGRPAPWLNGNAQDIARSTGLVIDGDVYILLNDGGIKKFETGNESEWRSQTLLDPPAAASRFQSPRDSKYLYAFDRESRRIFIWDKSDGHLIVQYLLPTINDLKDFTVDEANRFIYFLNGNEVAKIALE